jgi:hypothetical protein
MLKVFGAMADRLVGMVVPRTSAGACACEGGFTLLCSDGFLWSCQLNCGCHPHNCSFAGRC